MSKSSGYRGRRLIFFAEKWLGIYCVGKLRRLRMRWCIRVCDICLTIRKHSEKMRGVWEETPLLKGG